MTETPPPRTPEYRRYQYLLGLGVPRELAIADAANTRPHEKCPPTPPRGTQVYYRYCYLHYRNRLPRALAIFIAWAVVTKSKVVQAPE